MICCKIVADYNNSRGNFEQLLTKLANCGDFLWNNGNLYFGNTTDYWINKKQIIKILRESGYSNFFISNYLKADEPKEGEFVNGWLCDKIVKINYNHYEHKSQELFAKTLKALDEIDAEIEELREKSENKNIKEGVAANG